MTTTAIAPRRHSTTGRLRPWWGWLLTALAFPPAGYLASLVVGPIDALPAALLGGAIAGGIVGAAQWSMLRRRGCRASWIVATSAGLGLGLTAGAALVQYRTSFGAVLVMGAIGGAVTGAAQVLACAALRRHVVAWTLATAALWVIGWAVTTAAGVSVDDQWPLFGISGALTVALVQGALVNTFIPPPRRAAGRG